jgi:hypothetical protein
VLGLPLHPLLSSSAPSTRLRIAAERRHLGCTTRRGQGARPSASSATPRDRILPTAFISCTRTGCPLSRRLGRLRCCHSRGGGIPPLVRGSAYTTRTVGSTPRARAARRTPARCSSASAADAGVRVTPAPGAPADGLDPDDRCRSAAADRQRRRRQRCQRHRHRYSDTFEFRAHAQPGGLLPPRKRLVIRAMPDARWADRTRTLRADAGRARGRGGSRSREPW